MVLVTTYSIRTDPLRLLNLLNLVPGKRTGLVSISMSERMYAIA